MGLIGLDWGSRMCRVGWVCCIGLGWDMAAWDGVGHAGLGLGLEMGLGLRSRSGSGTFGTRIEIRVRMKRNVRMGLD